MSKPFRKEGDPIDIAGDDDAIEVGGDADGDSDSDSDSDADGDAEPACPEGRIDCGDGVCSDLGTDRINCGACGNRCDQHFDCEAGQCVCSGTPEECGEVVCGDRICSATESSENCPQDCGVVGAEWTCDPAWEGAGDGCDCGCGRPDPDCGREGCEGPDCCGVDACDGCDYCWPTTGVCTEGELAAWTCSPTYFGTGDGCDCGCGIVDPDCTVAGCTDANCCALGACMGCDYCWPDTGGCS
ncbi:MAG: hypothetical protein HYY06_27105 [Deltaproteobacteria bacterium]|nr:hypothetical protein [Deltaproteobacteria bacterium]